MKKDIYNKLSAEQEALRIIDAMMSDDLSAGLNEEIRSWLSVSTHQAEKDLAIEKLFHKYVQPDPDPDQVTFKSFREICLILELDYPVLPAVAVRKLKKPRLRARLGYWSAVAAGLLIATGVWWFTGDNLTGGGQEVTRPVASTVYTSAGGVEHIVLPDGTLVALNANSSIVYESRGKVTLTGDAYFEVARNEEVPFVVSSPNLTVTVLGTCFQMNDRAEEVGAHVKLYSGEIVLAADDVQYEIVQGEWIHLDQESNTISRGAIGAETKPSWVALSMLSMEFASFEDILNTLSDYFGVSLRNDRPELNSELYSVSLHGNESLEEVISLIQLASNKFSYRIVDNTLIIE